MILIQLVIYMHDDKISLLCFMLLKIIIHTLNLGFCNSTLSERKQKEAIPNRMVVDTYLILE